MSRWIQLVSPDEMRDRQHRQDDAIRNSTQQIIDRIERDGEQALRHFGTNLDALDPKSPLIIDRAELEQSLLTIPQRHRLLMERCAARIKRFAKAQLDSLREFSIDIPGGQAGQEISPLARVGCYAPAGKHPLPTSLLMSVCTAKVAGVPEVWVASPHPSALIKACAAIAGAHVLIPLGGAQAITAMGLGIDPIPRCDLVAGPGNAWVTTAKRLLAGRVNIDMLAGPSELLIIADQHANPSLIAADLIAQAEHDLSARPMLITTEHDLISQVEESLSTQAAERAALAPFLACVLDSPTAIAKLANDLAPEHLQLMIQGPSDLREQLCNYGSLFIGEYSAEVYADYGIGPNHVLPTSGAARQRGGLSVFDFLRIRTWVELGPAITTDPVVAEVTELAVLEGLYGHARAAKARTELCAAPSSHVRSVDNHSP